MSAVRFTCPARHLPPGILGLDFVEEFRRWVQWYANRSPEARRWYAEIDGRRIVEKSGVPA